MSYCLICSSCSKYNSSNYDNNKSYWKPISLGIKKDNRIPYLAFADGLAIMTNSWESAIKLIETLKGCAEKRRFANIF